MTARVEQTCKCCGTKFYTWRYLINKGVGQFCSNKCSATGPRNRVTVQCLSCGKDFVTLQSRIDKGEGKYCSKICTGAGKRTRKEVACKQCGKLFIAVAAELKAGKGKYCSRECFGLSQKVEAIERICMFCGKKFYVWPCKVKYGYARYCSSECHAKGSVKSVERQCMSCGKVFTATPSTLKNGGGKYCSKPCQAIGKSGAGSHNWKGGRGDYRGENWKAQRRSAIKRDGGRCQICNRKPKGKQRNFDVHHIKPYNDFNGDWLLANDLSNLITLCKPCHVRAERGLIATPVRLL